MPVLQLNPYLNLNGDAAQAIELYKSALGATVESVMRFADMPGGNVPAAMKDRVMHATLRIGGAPVMISDAPPDHPVTVGNNHHISLNYSDTAEMQKAYDALVAGGQATLPFHDAFWGAKFGMLTDRFGIGWMFTAEHRKK
jgi:PhnB protein